MYNHVRRSILVLGILLFLVAPAHAGGNRTAFASPTFASCAVRVDCPPGSCSDSAFEVESDCSAACSAQGGPAGCNAQIQTHTAPETWEMFSILWLFLPGGDTPNIQATYDVTGTRTSAEQLQLSGRIDMIVINETAYFQGGAFELAVFRYSGDPGDLEDVQVESVDQLVAAGLIDADDILFVETFPYTSSNFNLPFDFDVDVSGVPSDEIVVFASEAGITLVPALSDLGLLMLTALMLAAATYVLRKRLSCAVKSG